MAISRLTPESFPVVTLGHFREKTSHVQREIVRSSSSDSAYIAERSFSRWNRFGQAFERAKSAKATMAIGGENCAVKGATTALRSLGSLTWRKKTVVDSRGVSNFLQCGLILGEIAVQLISDRQNGASLLPRESGIKLKTDVFFPREKEEMRRLFRRDAQFSG